MYDLILLSTLVLPLLAVMLLGRHFERGLAGASPEVQAQRRYRLAWAMNIGIVGQAALMGTALAAGWERMAIPGWLFAQIGSAVDLLAGVVGRKAGAALLSVMAMLAIVLYYGLYALPWLRLDRIAKGVAGGAARRRQLRLSLRGTVAGVLPLVLWFVAVDAFLPRGFLSDPAHLVLLLAGFILIVHSFSPWLVQLANPTAPLPAGHPVAQMAMALAADAGVRIESVRVIELGETRVANALVSGLWPWLRRIYVTDHMLATFSVDEIRAILAHEIGHVRHRHLWCYLGFALGGALAIPRLIEALDQLAFLRHSAWGFLIAIGLYWGVTFKFFSRRFERQADRFAVAATGDVAAFQRALEKLAEANGMVRQYAKWDIFQSHPPIAERIRRLE